MSRVLSGAVLLAGAVAALWLLPPVALLGIAIVVALLAFREYADLAARGGLAIPRVAGGIAVALVCVGAGLPGMPLEIAVAAAVVGLAAASLARTAAHGAPDAVSAGALTLAAVGVLAPLYIGLPLGLLSATRWLLGREALLLLILTVVISDTAQYYCGRALGRRPLAPVISPKKTVEGAIGGVIGGMAAVAVIGYWWLPHLGIAPRLLLGAAVAIVGIVGDLFESALKRSVNMKDASALIPGHGGILDRIDALLFAAPVYYAFTRYGF